METNKVLFQDSIDYEGEIAWCGSSGGGTSYPAMSEEEKALIQKQMDVLEKTEADQALLRPFLLQQMGLEEDEEGNLVKMSDEDFRASLSGMELGAYELAETQQDYMMKAYAGELPISPGMETNITEQKKQIVAALKMRLGEDWALTTAGQHAIAGFETSAEMMREEARRGMISSGTGDYYTSLEHLRGKDVTQSGMASSFVSGGNVSGLLSGYSGLQSQFGQQRHGMYQAAAGSQQSRDAKKAGLMSGFGQLAGSGMMAAAIWSSAKLKENLKIISDPVKKLKAITGYEFDWNDKTRHKDKHDVGVIAEELEKVMPEAIANEGSYKAVYYYKIIPLLVEAIKSQQKEIDILKEVK